MAMQSLHTRDQENRHFKSQAFSASDARLLHHTSEAETLKTKEIYPRFLSTLHGYAPSPLHISVADAADFKAVVAPKEDESVLQITDREGAILLSQPFCTAEPEGSQVELRQTSFSPNGRYLALAFHSSGSEAALIRIFDLQTGRFCTDTVGDVRFSTVAWNRDSSGFFYGKSELIDGVLTSQKLYLHKVGEDQEHDTLIFIDPETAYTRLKTFRSSSGATLLVHSRSGCSEVGNLVLISLSESPQMLQKTGPVESFNYSGSIGDDFFFLERGESGYEQLSALKKITGLYKKQVMIPEHNQVCLSASVHRLGALMRTNTDFGEELHFQKWSEERTRIQLPAFGSVSSLSYQSDTSLEVCFSNYTQAPARYRADLESGATELLEGGAPKIDLTVRTAYVSTDDGESIPVRILSSSSTNGTSAQCILKVYGGFGDCIAPEFSSDKIAWLENGGIYVEAGIRGGRERGWKWHDAAKGERKECSISDLIAVAEYLIHSGLTSSRQLGLSGYSTGGLIAVAAASCRPDLFGAVSTENGLFDLVRFTEHTAGPAWVEEFGDPSDESQAASVRALSPLERVRGRPFPPAFLFAAAGDDMVPPEHTLRLFEELKRNNESTFLITQQGLGHLCYPRSGVRNSRVDGCFCERKALELTFFSTFLR